MGQKPRFVRGSWQIELQRKEDGFVAFSDDRILVALPFHENRYSVGDYASHVAYVPTSNWST